MKTFTLEESQSLLPVLESLLNRAIEAKEKAEAIEGELQELRQMIFLAGGMLVDVPGVRRKRASILASVQLAKDSVQEIASIGVQVKDLDTGLLDFPCRLGDEVVLLCWKRGEERITHWHTMDSGFAGRQPLDNRFSRIRPERPN